MSKDEDKDTGIINLPLRAEEAWTLLRLLVEVGERADMEPLERARIRWVAQRLTKHLPR